MHSRYKPSPASRVVSTAAGKKMGRAFSAVAAFAAIGLAVAQPEPAHPSIMDNLRTIFEADNPTTGVVSTSALLLRIQSIDTTVKPFTQIIGAGSACEAMFGPFRYCVHNTFENEMALCFLSEDHASTGFDVADIVLCDSVAGPEYSIPDLPGPCEIEIEKNTDGVTEVRYRFITCLADTVTNILDNVCSASQNPNHYYCRKQTQSQYGNPFIGIYGKFECDVSAGEYPCPGQKTLTDRNGLVYPYMSGASRVTSFTIGATLNSRQSLVQQPADGPAYCDHSTPETRWCSQDRCVSNKVIAQSFPQQSFVYCSRSILPGLFCPVGSGVVHLYETDASSMTMGYCGDALYHDPCALARVGRQCCFEVPLDLDSADSSSPAVACVPDSECGTYPECEFSEMTTHRFRSALFAEFLWKSCYPTTGSGNAGLDCHPGLMAGSGGVGSVLTNYLSNNQIETATSFTLNETMGSGCIALNMNGPNLCECQFASASCFRIVEATPTIEVGRYTDFIDSLKATLPTSSAVDKTKLLDHRWYDQLFTQLESGDEQEIQFVLELNPLLNGAPRRARRDTPTGCSGESVNLNNPDLTDLPEVFDNLFVATAYLCDCTADSGRTCYSVAAPPPAPPSAPSPSPSPSPSPGLSGGAIAGIVVGSVAGVAAIGGGIWAATSARLGGRDAAEVAALL